MSLLFPSFLTVTVANQSLDQHENRVNFLLLVYIVKENIFVEKANALLLKQLYNWTFCHRINCIFLFPCISLFPDGSVAECLCSVMPYFYTFGREDLDTAFFTTLENLVWQTATCETLSRSPTYRFLFVNDCCSRKMYLWGDFVHFLWELAVFRLVNAVYLCQYIFWKK